MAKGKQKLTNYQSRILLDYEKILEKCALNPDRIFHIADEESDAVVPVLRTMIDQVVRSEIILEYTMIDSHLDFLLIEHVFGSGNKLRNVRRTKRFRTFHMILQNMYLLQKLSIVKTFKNIPRSITSKITAINDLRNGVAHAFFLSDLKKSKRTYKGVNVFTPKGLEKFRKDSLEISYFFEPWLKEFLEEDSGA